MSTEKMEPVAWLREQRGCYEGSAVNSPLLILGRSEVRPHNALCGATYEPLYDQAALDAALAAERERCASAVVEQYKRWPNSERDQYIVFECAAAIRQLDAATAQTK